jgi:hypothetical protein
MRAGSKPSAFSWAISVAGLSESSDVGVATLRRRAAESIRSDSRASALPVAPLA